MHMKSITTKYFLTYLRLKLFYLRINWYSTIKYISSKDDEVVLYVDGVKYALYRWGGVFFSQPSINLSAQNKLLVVDGSFSLNSNPRNHISLLITNIAGYTATSVFSWLWHNNNDAELYEYWNMWPTVNKGFNNEVFWWHA